MRIEGYAVVSEDGMLATADRVMPDALIVKADQEFFEHGLDGVDVVVHGRHSQERQARSASRKRLMLTTRVASVEAHPANPNCLLWNPAGAPLEDALASLGRPGGSLGVIGGAEVFALFLDRYDVFHLSRVAGLTIPGGLPVFPGVPETTPEAILAAHGLIAGPSEVLDAVRGLRLMSWRPAAG